MRKVNLNIFAAVCVFMMTLAVPTGAITHYISPGQSIQAAIDAASNDDEIEVWPGTYNEAINFKGKAVRLYSSGGPAVTTIDGTGNYHVVQCVNGEDANTILEDFTITGGNANGSNWPDYCGGGMYCESSSPTVNNCTFSGNSAIQGGGMTNVLSKPTVTNCTFSGNSTSTYDGMGGGMYNNNSSPMLTDCMFTGNAADRNGGGMVNWRSSPTLKNCTFSENEADFYGGGMYNWQNSSPTVTNCTFNNNASVYVSGGGMYNGGDMYSGGDSSPTVTNCTFNDNTAGECGGGVYNGDWSSPTVTDCTFSGNKALIVGGGMFDPGNITNCTFIGNSAGNGGGICYGGPNVTNCLFKGNSADNYGGGLYFFGNSPTVANCTFTNNEAVAGGGIYGEESSLTVTGCRFIGNSAEQGGGMFKRYGTLTLTNCTFTANSVILKGAGLHNFENGSPEVANCTFSGNSAGDSGGGMYNENSSPTVTNCILWGDEPNEIAYYSGNPTITYCNVQGGWGDPNDPNNKNIDVDPSFVDANNPDPNLWNLRLKLDSPCIDAADSTVLFTLPVPVDLDGNVRCFDVVAIPNTGSGPLEFLDMGAYEFDCNYTAGDVNCDGVVDFKDLAILCGNWLAGTEPEL